MTFIELRGGLTVPEEAIVLAFHLLNQGLELKHEGDRLRVSGPQRTVPSLTPEDTAAIVRWKMHLLALVDYEAP